VTAFYLWLVCLFYSFTGPLRRDRFLMFLLLLGIHSEIEKIIHWMPEILFAAEIAFRGLDRCMPEQELNLLKLTAAVVAQLRTRSPQIMRRDVL
jgi:hypothetical protein